MTPPTAEIQLCDPYRYMLRVKMTEHRRRLVTSLANGFDFDALKGDDRKWMRLRRLVNRYGLVTDKGRHWARKLLAEEADRLMATGLDFMEE